MKIISPRRGDSKRQIVFEDFNYEPFCPRVFFHSGLVRLVRIGLVYPDLTLNSFLSYHYPVAFFRSLVLGFISLMKRGTRPINFSEDYIPAIIHTGWASGYYHWLTESLPRALMLKDTHWKAIPVLPLDIYSKYLPSLKAIGIDKVIPYPDGSNVRCYGVLITECPKIFGTTSPDLLRRVRDEVKQNLAVNESEAKELIYVSRAKSRGRKIANEDEVVELVVSFGGKIIFFEDLSFEEQVRTMGSCKTLVGIHGAGLANMMFMPPGGIIVELLAKRNGIFDYRKIGNSFKHQACYWRLAEAMGHEHEFILGHPCVPWYSRTDMADVIVDLECLRRVLAKNITSSN